MVGPALAPSRGLTQHRARDADSKTDGDVSHEVLIFSSDPLAAALLGAAVDLGGYSPHFPLPGEGARAALLRVRPGITLIDCDHEDACSEAFIGPALMTGAKVQLFRSRHTRRDASSFARRLGLSVAVLPMEHDVFTALLNEHLGTPP